MLDEQYRFWDNKSSSIQFFIVRFSSSSALNKSSQITAQKFYEIEKNKIHTVDHLFKSNEKKYMEIKNFWEEEDLASQKQYCSFNKNSFHNF